MVPRVTPAPDKPSDTAVGTSEKALAFLLAHGDALQFLADPEAIKTVSSRLLA